MGLKKYEIITVGGNKRVRALRSWQVGDRYVNIGDTGGIVYDEKTLSQDGACWLFSGNFSFPGARIAAYFGGNSVVYRDPSTVDFYGSVFMKDNAVFTPTALTGPCALVHMEGNAKFVGSVAAASTNLSVIMKDNAIVEGTLSTRSCVSMSDNARVTPTGIITDASRGVIVMEDNASIEANTIVIGAITLSGNYKGDKAKTWVGKRTITDVNEPEYDNNVKTEYDF